MFLVAFPKILYSLIQEVMLEESLNIFQMYGLFSFGALLYTCVIYSANIKVCWVFFLVNFCHHITSFPWLNALHCSLSVLYTLATSLFISLSAYAPLVLLDMVDICNIFAHHCKLLCYSLGIYLNTMVSSTTSSE